MPSASPRTAAPRSTGRARPRVFEVVKLGALAQALPAGARRIGPEERTQQQAERARQLARRLER